jgi:hypothetical protein
MFCLERLQAGDLVASSELLQALGASLNENAVPEYAPFGNALAQRLQVGSGSGGPRCRCCAAAARRPGSWGLARLR